MAPSHWMTWRYPMNKNSIATLLHRCFNTLQHKFKNAHPPCPQRTKKFYPRSTRITAKKNPFAPLAPFADKKRVEHQRNKKTSAPSAPFADKKRVEHQRNKKTFAPSAFFADKKRVEHQRNKKTSAPSAPFTDKKRVEQAVVRCGALWCVVVSVVEPSVVEPSAVEPSEAEVSGVESSETKNLRALSALRG